MDLLAEKMEWHRPDNTSHLFSAVSCQEDPHVFQVRVRLEESISPRILEKALNQVIPYFRAFDVAYKQGVFGGKFVAQLENPVVQEASSLLCQHFTKETDNGFLFRFLYQGCQIHLEVFHAITDGTGALEFLKAVVYRYIQLKYPHEFDEEDQAIFYGIENASKTLDAYAKTYQKINFPKEKNQPAFIIKGKRKKIEEMQVSSIYMNVSDMKLVAKNYKCTIGQYMTAIIIQALQIGYKGEIDRPISIELPVNLRPIFNMETSLNFFSNINILLDTNQLSYSFEEIVSCVKKQYKEKIKKELFEQRIGLTVWGEHCMAVQMTPIVAKNWLLKRFYEMCKNRSTLGFSNLGDINLRKEFEGHIKEIAAFSSPTPMVPIKIVSCSVNGEFCMTISSRLYEDILFQRIKEILSQQKLYVRTRQEKRY